MWCCAAPTEPPWNIYFPAEVHRGININIDLNQVPRCLNCILSDVDVEPRRLLQKSGLEDRPFHYLRKNKQLSNIFEEFYDIPEPVRKGYLKVKVQEVLLFLTGMELSEYDSPKRKLSKAQIQIARNAHAWLAEHMYRRRPGTGHHAGRSGRRTAGLIDKTITRD